MNNAYILVGLKTISSKELEAIYHDHKILWIDYFGSEISEERFKRMVSMIRKIVALSL